MFNLKQTMEFRVFHTWDEEMFKRRVDELFNAIKDYCHSPHNYAFWGDNRDEHETHCIMIKGFLGSLSSGKYLANNEIESAVYKWCDYIAHWCQDCPDMDVHCRHASKTLNIHLSSCWEDGGLKVICWDKDGKKDHEFHLLPIDNEKV